MAERGGTVRKIVNAPVKWWRILQILASGQRLTRFEAEHIGDHTLPQTLDRISRNGVPVQTETIEVPCYGGTKAHVARYSLITILDPGYMGTSLPKY